MQRFLTRENSQIKYFGKLITVEFCRQLYMLFDGNGFRQVAWLIYVRTLNHCDMVSQKL